jgi:hypothetical protein
MRRRNEPALDEGGLTDSVSVILKELRLLKKEMESKKAEFEDRLAEITQNISLAADQDTASSTRTANKETVERMDVRATEAQPKAGTPEIGVNGDSRGGHGDEEFHLQMAAETVQERVGVIGSRQHFATLRPDARTYSLIGDTLMNRTGQAAAEQSRTSRIGQDEQDRTRQAGQDRTSRTGC